MAVASDSEFAGMLSRREIDLLGSDDEDIASELPVQSPTPAVLSMWREISRLSRRNPQIPHFDGAALFDGEMSITRCVAQSLIYMTFRSRYARDADVRFICN